MNNSPWQSTFGKLLIISSVVAAVAGFAVVNAAKDGANQPQDEAASNQGHEMEGTEPSALDMGKSSAPEADQAITEPTAEPAVEQLTVEEQSDAATPTATESDEEGVQQ